MTNFVLHVVLLATIMSCDAGVIPTLPELDAGVQAVAPTCTVQVQYGSHDPHDLHDRARVVVTGACMAPAHIRGGARTADGVVFWWLDQPLDCPINLITGFDVPIDPTWIVSLYVTDRTTAEPVMCSDDPG